MIRSLQAAVFWMFFFMFAPGGCSWNEAPDSDPAHPSADQTPVSRKTPDQTHVAESGDARADLEDHDDRGADVQPRNGQLAITAAEYWLNHGDPSLAAAFLKEVPPSQTSPQFRRLVAQIAALPIVRRRLPLPEGMTPYFDAQILPDQKTLVFCSSVRFAMVDLSGEQPPRVIELPFDDATVTLSSNTTGLVVEERSRNDHVFWRFDLETLSLKRMTGGVRDSAKNKMAPDGSSVAIVGRHGQIYLWPGEKWVFDGYDYELEMLEFSPDSKQLAILDTRGLWLVDVSGVTEPRSVRLEGEFDSRTTTLRYTADSQSIAVFRTTEDHDSPDFSPSKPSRFKAKNTWAVWIIDASTAHVKGTMRGKSTKSHWPLISDTGKFIVRGPEEGRSSLDILDLDTKRHVEHMIHRPDDLAAYVSPYHLEEVSGPLESLESAHASSLRSDGKWLTLDDLNGLTVLVKTDTLTLFWLRSGEENTHWDVGFWKKDLLTTKYGTLQVWSLPPRKDPLDTEICIPPFMRREIMHEPEQTALERFQACAGEHLGRHKATIDDYPEYWFDSEKETELLSGVTTLTGEINLGNHPGKAMKSKRFALNTLIESGSIDIRSRSNRTEPTKAQRPPGNSWTLLVHMPALQSVHGGLTLQTDKDSWPSSAEFIAPTLEVVEGRMYLDSSFLTNVDVPKLHTVGGRLSIVGGHESEVSLPSLANVEEGLELTWAGINHSARSLGVDLPSLARVKGDVKITSFWSSQSSEFSLPSLAYVDGDVTIVSLGASGCGFGVSLPSLEHVAGDVNFIALGTTQSACSSRVSLPSLERVEGDVEIVSLGADDSDCRPGISLPSLKHADGNVRIVSSSASDINLKNLQSLSPDGELVISAPHLEALALDSLTRAYSLSIINTQLQTLALPSLVETALKLDKHSNLRNVQLPNLRASHSLTFKRMPALKDLDLSALEETFNLWLEKTGLQSIRLPEAKTMGIVTLLSNRALTDFNAPKLAWVHEWRIEETPNVKGAHTRQ